MNRWARPFAVVAALALTLAACSKDESTPAKAALSLTSPQPGTTVEGNVVTLDLTPTGITIAKADGDSSGKTGHFHAFIDRDPVAAGATIPKEPGIVHSTEDPLKLYGLTVGKHTIAVVLGDGNHTRIGDAVVQTEVTVAGPSVKAKAQGTPAAGAPFKIDVQVEGFTIVKADGDTSGKSGHLHVFIDRDPTAAGQPIPKEDGIIHSTETTIETPALAAGDHTIWVLAGDGAHVLFDPQAADVLKFTI